MKLSKIFKLSYTEIPSNFQDKDVSVVFILGDQGKSSTSEILFNIIKNKKVVAANFNDKLNISNRDDIDEDVYDAKAFLSVFCSLNLNADILLCEVSNSELTAGMEKYISLFDDAIVVVNSVDSSIPVIGDRKNSLFQHTKNLSKQIKNKKNMVLNTSTDSEEFNKYFANKTDFFRFNKENSDVFGTGEKTSSGLLLTLNVIKEKILSNLKSSAHLQNILAAISVLISLNMLNVTTIVSVLKSIVIKNKIEEFEMAGRRIIMDKSSESTISLRNTLSELDLDKETTTVILSAVSYNDKVKNRNRAVVNMRKEKFSIISQYAKNIIVTNSSYNDENTYIANLDFNGEQNYTRDRYNSLENAINNMSENGTLIILGGDLEKDREIIEQLTME